MKTKTRHIHRAPARIGPDGAATFLVLRRIGARTENRKRPLWTLRRLWKAFMGKAAA